MFPFFLFLLGCVLGALTMGLVWLARQRRAPAPLMRTPPAQLDGLTQAMGTELGNLSGAVEGHAELLCEAFEELKAPVPLTPLANLRASVRRLRLLSEKIRAADQPRRPRVRPVDVERVVDEVRAELEQYPVRSLQIEVTTEGDLPPVHAEPEPLTWKLLFLVQSLLEREPEARALGLRLSAKPAPGAEDAPVVTIAVEVDGATGQETPTASLGESAARNLLESMGGGLRLQRARAVVSLRGAPRQATADVAAESPTAEPLPSPRRKKAHPFGGVLVFEPDTALLELIKAELSRVSRRAICCADIAAAESLFRATPERFELMVLDGTAQSAEVRALMAAALAECPGLHVLQVAEADEDRERSAAPRRTIVYKPFSARDLRNVFGKILGPPPAARDAV